MKRVVEVEAIAPSTLSLTFRNGREVQIDVADLLKLEAFAPLVDLGYFAKAEVDEIGGISWPNGADLSPEYLEETVSKASASRR